MRVLVAPDKFKGTISAAGAACAIAAGVRDVYPDASIDLCPVADGGDGSHDVVVSAGFDEVPVAVCSADGLVHATSFARREHIAVLELARLCGTSTLIAGPNAWTSHTRGLGEAMLEAVTQGATEVVICIGGSASVDGGTGMLAALGYGLIDGSGNEVAPGLRWISDICDVSPPRNPFIAKVVVVCDVSTPLLGATGGIRLYSGQKGLSPVQVVDAEGRLDEWARVTARVLGSDFTNTPGGGSAGGVGFAAVAYLGAEFRQGLDFFDNLIELPRRIKEADLVITGEGTLDQGSLDGKTPVGVARRAAMAKRPCLIIAGRVELCADHEHPFTAYRSLVDTVGEAYALSDTSRAIREATRELLIASQ